jgi:hypothetical protein
MGRLGKWDTVERKKRIKTYSKQDEFFDYLKIALYLLLTYLYFHFIIMGWHL